MSTDSVHKYESWWAFEFSREPSKKAFVVFEVAFSKNGETSVAVSEASLLADLRGEWLMIPVSG